MNSHPCLYFTVDKSSSSTSYRTSMAAVKIPLFCREVTAEHIAVKFYATAVTADAQSYRVIPKQTYR